ncbi:Tfp pilus assembly protein FimT/FimU [Acidovorax radicis]|uniref:pilus assembly FimT family protein n=1 Tax=Acidovorax radicis TaxID=758826 RepID=UPI001CFA16FF|nr:type II secretion system protein [Acidovorax radicis]UCU99841.1 type II secretion system protein [Acidovorax radicis]
MTGRVRRVSGFTLIELLVVFAIMALVVGLVPVAMDRMRESAQYRDTVRTALSQLKAARDQAVTSGRGAYFVIDLPQRRYGLDASPLVAVPESLQMKAVVAALEGEQSHGRLLIRFLPSGGSSGGSVEIIRNTGSGVRLRVDWLSGRVTQEALLP